MADLPIIFSAHMVRALAAGRKTQTRRLATSPLRRVQPGDRLYVREAWRLPANWDDRAPNAIVESCREAGWRQPWAPIAWEADGTRENWGEWREHEPGRLRPSMHLPRPFSRMTLIVEGVKVEPLQSITAPDALAEGIERELGGWKTYDGGPRAIGQRESFASLRASLHTKPGERWEDNPDVVALTFRVRRGNIDRVPA
jgi:hypothetical protein